MEMEEMEKWKKKKRKKTSNQKNIYITISKYVLVFIYI